MKPNFETYACIGIVDELKMRMQENYEKGNNGSVNYYTGTVPGDLTMISELEKLKKKMCDLLEQKENNDGKT